VLQKFVDDFFADSSDMVDRIDPKVVFSRQSSRSQVNTNTWADVHATDVKGAFWLGPEARELFGVFDQVFSQFAIRFRTGSRGSRAHPCQT